MQPVPLPGLGNPLRVGDRDLHPVPPPNFNPYGGSNGEPGNLFGPGSSLFTGGRPGYIPQGPHPGSIRQDQWGPDGLNGSFPDNNDLEPIYRPTRGY